VLALVSAASANADPTGAKLRHPVSDQYNFAKLVKK
jgi:hypothetical protein